MMPLWRALLMLMGAIIYVVVPWDFDFVPFVGRLDDLLVLGLAVYYYWKRTTKNDESFRTSRRRGATEEKDRPGGEEDESRDPYLLLGVGRKDGQARIKKAYRDLLGRYHPDRVQHLGEEFQRLAAEKTVRINRAYEQIREEKGFS